jgi:LacI family transcriptional regulator
MRKKQSIHDIAKELKVSAATISYVLNGKAREKRISTALEKKILNYVKKYNYRPNMLAKSLRIGKSKVIAMLVEGIDDPFFASITRIVEKEMSQKGYKTFFASTENDPMVTIELIKVFRDAQVDGFIIAPPPDIEDSLLSLIKDNIPLVLFDRYFPELETSNVMVDNFQGTYEAMQYFFKLNYKHIGFVTLDSSQIQMSERLKGYKKEMREKHLLTCIQKISFELRQEQKKITEIIKKFLAKNGHIEAVLFATNYLSISGLEAIRILKIKIPNDMAIIGFDDNTHFSLFTPTVTAIAQPVRELSEQIVKQLMVRLNGEGAQAPKKTIVLPTRLVVRESSIPTKMITNVQNISG